LTFNKHIDRLGNIFTFFGSILLLFFSFSIQFAVMKLVYPFKKASFYEVNDYIVKIKSLILSLMVVILNVVLRKVVYKFISLRGYESNTTFLSNYISR
jgi:hypothetical protein